MCRSNQLLSPDHTTHPLPPVDQTVHRSYYPAPVVLPQTRWGEIIYPVLTTNHLPPGFMPLGPPIGTLLQVDTPASTETILIPIPPPGPYMGFSSAYTPLPTSGLAILPDVTGLGRLGMSKPTLTSDSTCSKMPRTHYLNIYGPPLSCRVSAKMALMPRF